MDPSNATSWGCGNWRGFAPGRCGGSPLLWGASTFMTIIRIYQGKEAWPRSFWFGGITARGLRVDIGPRSCHGAWGCRFSNACHWTLEFYPYRSWPANGQDHWISIFRRFHTAIQRRCTDASHWLDPRDFLVACSGTYRGNAWILRDRCAPSRRAPQYFSPSSASFRVRICFSLIGQWSAFLF